MILHVLKNKGSDREIDKQSLKYYQRPVKMYKPRLQGSNRSLKKSWMKIQSTLDKWNLHGTEKNGSTYRMFHLSELLDKWNLYETEKKVPLIELLSYLKSQETEEFTNNQKQGEEEKKKAL